jgi:hypothetical protein
MAATAEASSHEETWGASESAKKKFSDKAKPTQATKEEKEAGGARR